MSDFSGLLSLSYLCCPIQGDVRGPYASHELKCIIMAHEYVVQEPEQLVLVQ